MKIQAYCPEKVEAEKVVTLRLIESGNEIVLAVVDEEGQVIENGRIGNIDSEGVLTIYRSLNPKIGLQIADSHSGISVHFS